MISENNFWSQESDELLKYFYQDLQIFNWSLISKEISQRMRVQTTADQCRNRYVEKYGPVIRGQWTPQEQKQLYRLHDQNGNRWAVIAQNLLGRNDNCVKNHFYSKLRKSLRTINKIAKLHLKKQARQISDVVIYKLTQATDQSLKQNSEIPKEIISMCYDLKNRLLEYEMDQKDIKDNLDYRSEKELLQGLAEFNKIYKKKSKKEKISVLGTENLKKKKTERGQKKNKNLNIYSNENDGSYEADQEYQEQSEQEKSEPKKEIQRPNTTKSQSNTYLLEKVQATNKDYLPLPAKSQSNYSSHKKTINYLIKAPSKQDQNEYEKNIELISHSSKIKLKDQNSHISLSSALIQNKNRNKIEDILKAEGILQNQFEEADNFFRHENSIKSSFSVCSQPSNNVDMFGEDLGFGAHFKQLSSMENDSHFLKNNQNQ